MPFALVQLRWKHRTRTAGVFNLVRMSFARRALKDVAMRFTRAYIGRFCILSIHSQNGRASIRLDGLHNFPSRWICRAKYARVVAAKCQAGVSQSSV